MTTEDTPVSERKWTKGEWEVRDVHGELHIHAPDTFGHGFRLEMRIASDVGGYRSEREDGSWDDSEVIANARLIAAAPDLYEALSDLMDSFPGDGDWQKCRDKARAALQRAEGEE